MKILCSVVAAGFLIMNNASPSSAAGFDNSANSIIPAYKLFVSDASVPTSMQFKVGLCVGLVIAAGEVGQATDELCVRKNVSLVQSIRIVLKWAESNPQLTDLPFSLIAMNALKDVFPFPCDEQ